MLLRENFDAFICYLIYPDEENKALLFSKVLDINKIKYHKMLVSD